MFRRYLILALLAVAAHWQAVYAQTLSVPPLTPQGQPIIARIEGLPDGARVAWKASPGASAINGGKGRAYLWGSASHSVSAVIALADADADLLWLEAPFVVGDAPPTPPPVVQTLAQLAGDKAAALSAMYAEFATALAGGLFDDVAHFRRTEAAGLTGRKLAGHGATAAIAERLDVTSLDELQAAVALVVEELGAGPTPPPVPPTPAPGKRHVVILHETEDQSPDEAILFNELRTGESAKTLKAAGHTLDILDDELRPDLTGVPLPAMYVTDPATKAVLYSQPMPRTAPEIVGAIR